MISVVILAAGRSERMGEAKLLLPLGQSTVIEETLSKYLALNVHEIILVIGAYGDKIRQLLRNKSVKIVFNSDYRIGISSSIRAGVKEIDLKTQGIMIALGDLPLIKKETVDCLIENFYSAGKGIVVPVFRGRTGHPVIFNASYRHELMQLTGDSGARRIIEKHRDDVYEMTVEDEGAITDIDTPREYNEICRRFIPKRMDGS